MEDQDYSQTDVVNHSPEEPRETDSHQQEEPQTSHSFQEELRNKERENQMLREQLMMMKEYQERQRGSQQQNGFRELEDIDDDGYVPATHFKQNVAMLKALKEEHELLKRGMIEYIGRLEQEKVQKKYPQLMGQQAELEKILNQDPDLKAAYEANPNPHVAAAILRAHKNSQEKQESAQRIVSNAKKTGSLASVGGAPIDNVSRIDKMSREEFLKYAFENKTF